jgi:hypothetical protein
MKRSILIISLLLTVMCLLGGHYRAIDGVDAQNTNSSRPRPSPTATQPAGTAAEELNNLIVMIKCQIAGDDKTGAGIIFGKRGNRLYIATANHVVRSGTDEAQNLRVLLRWMPGEWKTAVLLDNADSGLDLAVLGLDLDPSRASPELQWDQLADPRSLRSGDSVYSVGYPGGRPWYNSVTPDRFSRNSRDSILFESTSISPGDSGGALLNERRRIVGLIREIGAPNGRAVNIQSVIETLKDWGGYPVDLRTVLQEGSIVLPVAGGTSSCADLRNTDVEVCTWLDQPFVPRGDHSEFQISLTLKVGMDKEGCPHPHRHAEVVLSCGNQQQPSGQLGMNNVDHWTQDYSLTKSCTASGSPVSVKITIHPLGCTKATLSSGELTFKEIE